MRKLLVYADLHWPHKSASRAERSRSSPTVGSWHKRFDLENACRGTLRVFVSAWFVYSVWEVPHSIHIMNRQRGVFCVLYDRLSASQAS